MKKIFTLITLALMAMGVSAQEVALFDNGGTYGNGATLSTANAQVVLGNDRTTKNYDLKLSTCKDYCAPLFGQTVQVQNEDTGEMEDKTRVVYVVGNQNPKDGELDGDKSSGSGYKPENANLPQSGTYYMFTPKKNGHVVSFIILNSGKNFYVVKGSDGTNLPISEYVLKADGEEATVVNFNDDYTVDEKTTGTIEFDVVANETYYIFCTGSKLSYGGYVFTPEGGDTPQDLTEVTLWEGSVLVNGWADQPYLLSDGGTELKAVNAKAGDVLRFYMSAPDNNWQLELIEGHWGPQYIRWSGAPLVNEDGSPRESVVVDLNEKGYAELTLTDEILENAYKSQNWGGVFVLNGDGNLTVTKLTILKDAGDIPQPQPEGEKVRIIDQFVNTWNSAENYSINGDGSITFNAAEWGGLAAWLAPDGVLSDWTPYSKLVFEFTNNPVPVAVQGFVQCLDNDNAEVNNTWWGNAGIEKLECPFEGKDMSRVQQAALQVSAEARIIITDIYLVMDVNGIQETVSLTKSASANAPMYNLAGVRVNKDYKGIVIQNGRKFIQK